MISVESRNGGRRSLGVGFGSGRDMEETELEEGEAYDYCDDADIDPDVDLSYLDEKVQVLLGDFQKDFEGGVSAENLGAKYGGYGSFLPTYQRSPSIWSQPRTPQKVQSSETPRSPNNLPIEGDFQNSAVPPGANFSIKHVTSSTGAAPPLISRVPLLDSSSKKKFSLSSSKETLASNSNNEPLNRPSNTTNQKTLKVRLKVGGSDHMAKKTAAIFSDLGFQLSSPDDSPIESGGFSPESLGSPDESPTHILQIMTSPVSKGLLLSPLPDSLLHLTGDKPLRDNRYGFACRGGQGSSSMLLEESTSASGEANVPREKKTQPVENNNKLFEKKSETGKNIGNGFSSLPSEKLDIDDSERKECVAEQSSLTSFSNSKCRVGETAKGMSQGSEGSGIRKFKIGESLLLDSAKEDSESIRSLDVNSTVKQKPKNISGDKVLENQKEKVSKDTLSLSEKDGHKSRRNKKFDSGNPDYDGSMGKRELNGRTIDPPENKVKLKVTPLERGGKLHCGRDQTLPEGKKKSKASKNNGNAATVLSHESSRVVTSTTSREHKKSSRDSSSKNKYDDDKFPREFNKARETYKDIFGDEEMEQAENSIDTPDKDRSKGYKLEVVEKQTRQFADKSKDKSSGQEIHQFADKSTKRSSSKKVENSLTSESYHKPAQNVAPERNGLAPDTSAATLPPVVIKENWVGCDKCEKWRLLPLGIGPSDLPKKWLCSMLNWLPNMNSCNISEEATTNAVTALNQSGLPAPEIQNNLQTQPNGVAVGVALPEVQNLNLKYNDHNSFPLPSGRNKKHGLKESADASNCLGPKYSSNSMSKNQQASLKSRSVNDANQSPLDSNLESKVGIRHLSKSSDSTGEKRRHKPKDKHKLAQDRGAASHSKIKSKRDSDQDGSVFSKKIKTESFNNEEWNSGHVGVMGNSDLTSSHCFSAKPDVCGTKKQAEYESLKESKFDTKDNPPVFSKPPNDQVQHLDARSLDVAKSDNRDIAAKKRKVKEWQESQMYQSQPHMDASHHYEVSVSLEGTSGSELKKGKKSRISKSEGKGSRKSSVDARERNRDRASQIQDSGIRDFVADEMVEGKDYADKDQQQSQYQRGNMMSQKMLDNMDPVKKDSGHGFPLAATSSSSKVSGSRKSKTNFHEAKGSPVESVSSSPMRIPDKGTSTRKIVLSNDDAVTAGLSTIGNLRRCSDEGDGGGGHSGSARKGKTHSVYHGSLESSVHHSHDREMNPTSAENSKALNEPYHAGFANPHLVNGGSDTIDQCSKVMELHVKEHGHDAEPVNKTYVSNGSHSRKSGKASSFRVMDEQKDSSSEVDKGKLKVSDSVNNQEGFYPTKNSRNEADVEQHELFHSREESMVGKYASEEKHGIKGGKDEKSCPGKKENHGKWSNDGVRDTQSLNEGNIVLDVKSSPACSKEGKSNAHQSSLQDRVGEKFSRHSLLDRPDHDHLETTSRRGKSHSFQQSGDKQEIQTRCPRPMSSYKGGPDLLRGDASKGGGDEFKMAKLPRKPDNQAGVAHNTVRHSTPGRVVAGDLEGPSPVRKDSSSQAATVALKEARDLKHSADRLKNSGSGLESTGLYFEAVLKFLHGASLLESCNIEVSRHGESQSAHVYSTTTSLCEFVAQEYERCKEMAFAALAYKCLEVACMRVVYFKHLSVNRDRHDLQTALQMVPPGESPSSSASDVDNLNNQGAIDKVPLAKGVGSPVVGNHVIAARNRPNFVRVLNFTQDVNSAMEASRKSLNAFAVASASLEESQYEGISSVKRALDFSFHDVQGLLRLVRLAMEAISS